jgi:septal ring factor EnvC (AmiA/AmiB activator)
MQASGLIFVTIVALVGEVMNISMTSIISKSVEKKITKKFMKIIDKYKAKVNQMKKRNIILEGQREDDTSALYDARESNKILENKVKEYEATTAKLEEKIKAQEVIIRQLDDLPGGSDSDT